MSSPKTTGSPTVGAQSPFPDLESAPAAISPTARTNTENTTNAHDSETRPPLTLAGRIRSLSKSFEQSDIPVGFFPATGSFASSALSPQPKRRGSLASTAPSSIDSPIPGDGVRSNRAGSLSSHFNTARTRRGTEPLPETAEHETNESPNAARAPLEKDGRTSDEAATGKSPGRSTTSAGVGETDPRYAGTAPFENGYHFPPSHGFVGSTKIGAIALWNYFLTPFGFCVVLYGLNVVAWGGMIFLLLCNAAPAMCHPTCNDIDSPRRKWIEYDSQILNALFCVTGFGLAPWRIRDLWYLMKYRLRGQHLALRRLAGIHPNWFRLPGSENVPIHIGGEDFADVEDDSLGGEWTPFLPYPLKRTPNRPLTGYRAQPTKMWKMDAVIWANIFNTVFQALLAGFMWGMNRYVRPSWAVGFFIGVALVLGIISGLFIFLEGKRVKSVEGVELSDADKKKLSEDYEKNIQHYNNYSDKPPKEEKEKAKKEKKEKKAKR
ncbi:hypothetical protein jhhlp_000243 [Lomentospora prolificans]|uniref:Uncharacterized protein n=1 Tax=Lomentospora prolificans TaxID=41688 RepID=A0A2N3NKC6_9PEZI|nr:hypothetical protein jhhlp_000243 [Lomentospora prolificans]